MSSMHSNQHYHQSDDVAVVVSPADDTTSPTPMTPMADQKLVSPDQYDEKDKTGVYDKLDDTDLERGGMSDDDSELSEIAQGVKLMKTTTALNTFFLLTTDFLAPAAAPYAIASTGYVTGALLYFFGGVVAAYTGWILIKLYIRYDTEADPIRTYGDISDHVFKYYSPRAGYIAKKFTAITQAINLFLLVGVVLLGNVQALYQISGNSVCFLYLGFGVTGLGMMLGCIKQLRNLSHLANYCIWLNCFVCVATIVLAATATSYSNIADAAPSSLLQAGFVPTDADGNGLLPAHATAFSTLPLAALMGGVSNVLYAYGGANLFIEIMCEMKNPRDFMKAYLPAVTFVSVVYMAYGVTVASLQGPYVGNPANQGITAINWQIACNAINVCTGMVAATLYGNVGIKVIYVTLFQDMFNAPPLTTRRGTWIWCITSICFWWGAFVLAEAIPQFSAFNGIVAAGCISEFTYILPPLYNLLYECQQDQTWRDMFYRRAWWKAIDLLLFLGALVAVGMALWGSIETLLSALDAPDAPQQFGCNGP